MAASSVTSAVLLDLDDTLIPEAVPLAEAYRAVAAAVWGPDSTAEQAQDVRLAARAYWEANAPQQDFAHRVHIGPSDGLSSGFLGAAPQLAQLREFLPDYRAHAFDEALPSDFTGDATQLRAVWWEARMGTQTVFPGAYDLLETLRTDYKLALVTNGTSDFQRYKIQHTGMGRCFDAVIVSGDLGSGKPNPEPFLAALHALDASTDQAVMIGNDQARDIGGAQPLGIRTIWVQPGDQTQRDAVTDLSQVPGLLRRRPNPWAG